jgi:hypothetical protein
MNRRVFQYLSVLRGGRWKSDGGETCMWVADAGSAQTGTSDFYAEVIHGAIQSISAANKR